LWFEWLLRGVLAALAFALLFLLAQHRWRQHERPRQGPADIGLD
jgi:integral membrane sensor domain MASE1